MKNMAMSKKEAKESTLMCGYGDGDGADDEAPKYPYGLSLSLNDDVMKKLGIKELPAVGTTMLLQAQVMVTSVSEYQEQGGSDKNVSLQITDMEMMVEAKSTKEIIYG